MAGRVVLAGGLLVLAMTWAAPAAQAERELHFEAFNAGGEFWFRVEGHPDRDPTIELVAGETVTVTLRSSGTMPHNLRFGPPVDDATLLLRPGMHGTFTFTVPDDMRGDFHYWCDPHREYPMGGVWRVVGPEEARAQETPWPPVGALLLSVVALVALRRASHR